MYLIKKFIEVNDLALNLSGGSPEGRYGEGIGGGYDGDNNSNKRIWLMENFDWIVC